MSPYVRQKGRGFLKANGRGPSKAMSNQLRMTQIVDEIDKIDKRIRELTLRLEELRLSLPAHSVKREMLMTIEETEEEIGDLRERREELTREMEGSGRS
jgi:chromosome segregation ATPase